MVSATREMQAAFIVTITRVTSVYLYLDED